ncbi:MAG: family 16 glycoside hydrolase, partial [Bryobacteraceae bacterium]
MLKAVVAILVVCATLAASAVEIKFDLSSATGGALPDGFASRVSGLGRPGDWKVVDEIIPRTFAPFITNGPTPTAKHSVFAQTSQDATAGAASLLLYTNEILKNFTLTTRVKIVTPGSEPAAGVVFRAQDESNYYVVRASTDGNLLWYRVVAGVRHETTGVGVRVPIATNTWQDLKLECDGNRIRCFLNGQLMIPPAKPGAPTGD